MAADESPINAVDLGSRVDDGSGGDSFQGYMGGNDGDGNIQGMLSAIRGLLNDGGGDWGCQGWRGLCGYCG